MIPSDLAARLQILTNSGLLTNEPPVQGLQRTREIQSQLPDLVPGERFFATLQRALPDGTFRAVVAGRQMTLSLDQAAKAGDTLELVVTQSSPRAIFAQIVNPNAANTQSSSFQALLSPTAKLISALLTGQPAPEPAQLNASRPLLNTPPQNSSQLAPALRQAVGQSGLFYESHLADWVTGKYDTASLLKEPQGQAQSSPAASQQPAPPSPATPQSTPGNNTTATLTPHSQPASTEQKGNPLTQQATHNTLNNNLPIASAPSTLDEVISSSTSRPASVVPERLMTVLHQQLEALGTQQYVWHGQIWPGQTMEWLIEDPRDGQKNSEEATLPEEWNTTLRITLPNMGKLEAQIHLTPAGIALRLHTEDDNAASALTAEQAQLTEALAAAGIPLTGMVIESPHENRN